MQVPRIGEMLQVNIVHVLWCSKRVSRFCHRWCEFETIAEAHRELKFDVKDAVWKYLTIMALFVSER